MRWFLLPEDWRLAYLDVTLPLIAVGSPARLTLSDASPHRERRLRGPSAGGSLSVEDGGGGAGEADPEPQRRGAPSSPELAPVWRASVPIPPSASTSALWPAWAFAGHLLDLQDILQPCLNLVQYNGQRLRRASTSRRRMRTLTEYKHKKTVSRETQG